MSGTDKQKGLEDLLNRYDRVLCHVVNIVGPQNIQSDDVTCGTRYDGMVWLKYKPDSDRERLIILVPNED